MLVGPVPLAPGTSKVTIVASAARTKPCDTKFESAYDATVVLLGLVPAGGVPVPACGTSNMVKLPIGSATLKKPPWTCVGRGGAFFQRGNCISQGIRQGTRG